MNVASRCLLEVSKPDIFSPKLVRFYTNFLGSSPLARQSTGIAQNSCDWLVCLWCITSSMRWTLQIFAHIMEIDREVYWEYANVSCAGYPLEHIDTISQNGKINTKSVMYQIVYGVILPIFLLRYYFCLGKTRRKVSKVSYFSTYTYVNRY